MVLLILLEPSVTLNAFFLKKRDSNLEFFENFEMRITLKFSGGTMSLFLQKRSARRQLTNSSFSGIHSNL